VPRRTPAERVALVVATGLGSGYGPIAPGTWGSIPGVVAFWGLEHVGPWVAAAGAALAAAVGVWAAGRAEGLFGEKDPGRVVIDEVAGQMVTLLFLPAQPLVLFAGFLLFRVLDVVKPWPARALEALPGGSGIMADDLMVGVYGNLILHALALWRPAWLGLA
jgi:phosphatidylglycerophosphatase A